MKRYELYLVLGCLIVCGSVAIAGEEPGNGSGNPLRKLSDSQELALKAEAAAAMNGMCFEYPGSKEVYYREGRNTDYRNQMKPLSDDRFHDCP